MFGELVQRLRSNYEESNKLLDARIEAGTQPSLPWANPQFLLYANLLYVVVTAVLYKWMKGITDQL